MGVSERRARDKENLRQAILDAAQELFLAEDYTAVSIRRIAEKIEYSPTTIYLYFKDKQDILFHLITQGSDMLARRIEAISHPDPLERLRLLGKAYLEFALTNPRYYNLMFQVDDPELARRCVTELSSADRTFIALALAVAEGQAKGLIRKDIPMELLVHSLWAHVHGAVSLTLSQRLNKLPPKAREAFFHAHTQLGLDGLRIR